MKRRDFLGSLFAAGAVLKEVTPIGNDNDAKFSGEVVAPAEQMQKIIMPNPRIWVDGATLKKQMDQANSLKPFIY
ncbi:hypothetical protein [Spirosoma sp. KNUC1025]|uniref:hypothetical protein n=1 Tax=Spirosoma sp. KNUC1025 TaxID=2894082 RepID=UPI00386782AD|nr:hypothetical protein LN737_19305 [Spirosoma sp. KNUC1025]